MFLCAGTHVAGIALGSIHGVARGAILHPVKVCGDIETLSKQTLTRASMQLCQGSQHLLALC
jgi:hypothetical protein